MNNNGLTSASSAFECSNTQLNIDPKEVYLAKLLHTNPESVHKIKLEEHGDPDVEVHLKEINLQNLPDFIINESNAPVTINNLLRALKFNYDKINKEWCLTKASSFWRKLHYIYEACFNRVSDNSNLNTYYEQKVPNKIYLGFLFSKNVHIHQRLNSNLGGSMFKICVPQITNHNYKEFIYKGINNREKIESKLKECGFKNDNPNNDWEVTLTEVNYILSKKFFESLSTNK